MSQEKTALGAREQAQILAVFASVLLEEPQRAPWGALFACLEAGEQDSCGGGKEALAVPTNDEFFNRFMVPCAASFVSARESRLAGSSKPRYHEPHASVISHLGHCYAAQGFDYKELKGFEPRISTLEPDDIAVEVAFLAFLKEKEALNPSEELQSFFMSFANDHVLSWIDVLIEMFEGSTARDAYAEALDLLRVFLIDLLNSAH